MIKSVFLVEEDPHFCVFSLSLFPSRVQTYLPCHTTGALVIPNNLRRLKFIRTPIKGPGRDRHPQIFQIYFFKSLFNSQNL